MDKKETLGLAGSIILLAGVFTPIVSVPLMGSMNYVQNGKGGGTVILLLAAASLYLVLKEHYNRLYFTGGGCLLVMAYTFISFQTEMSQARADLRTQFAGNPFQGLGDILLQSVQIQWGWAVIFIGVCLLIASAVIDEDEPTQPCWLSEERDDDFQL